MKLWYTCASSKCVSYLNVAFERWLDCRWIPVLRQLAITNYKIESSKRIAFQYTNIHEQARSRAHTPTDTGTHIRCQRWHMATISTKQTMSWISKNRCTVHTRGEKKPSSCLTVRHGNEMAKPIYLMAFLIPSEKYSSFFFGRCCCHFVVNV